MKLNRLGVVLFLILRSRESEQQLTARQMQ